MPISAPAFPKKPFLVYHEALCKGYTHEGVHYNIGLALLALGRVYEAMDKWALVLRYNPLYLPLVAQLYRLGRVVGAISPGDEVDERSIAEIKRRLPEWGLEFIRNRETPDIHLILHKENMVSLLTF